MRLMTTLNDTLTPLRNAAHRFLVPVALLAARLFVANDFFKSGWLKFSYVRNDDLDTLYFLFEDYHVPLLPVKVAAWMGMMGELGLSTLLALGLFARFGAAGLIVMSLIIYKTDMNMVAPFWALICLIVVAQGAGKLSLDALIWNRFNKPSMA